MTNWTNFAIRFSTSDAKEAFEEKLNELGLAPYGRSDTVIQLSESKAAIDKVPELIKQNTDTIESYIVVHANDTDDTASGRAYTITDDGDVEQVRSEHSGGQDSRHNWYGIRFDDMSVDGGAYY